MFTEVLMQGVKATGLALVVGLILWVLLHPWLQRNRAKGRVGTNPMLRVPLVPDAPTGSLNLDPYMQGTTVQPGGTFVEIERSPLDAALYDMRPISDRAPGTFPFPPAADIAEAENLLIVARAFYRDGAPLYVEDMLRMFEKSFNTVFYESPWLQANEWLNWLHQIAPSRWEVFLKLVPGVGSVIGELVPVHADRATEEVQAA